MAMDRSWFDSRFLARLEQLAMLSRKTFAGRTAGLRRSLKRGQGAEFDDYRNYVQGDDLRYLDWNLYGRLERLFLKISLQEEDLQVHLLIDSSRSMAFGEPGKLDHARRIAAALAYITLCGLDRVEITAFRGGLAERMPPCRGKGSIFQVFDFLSRLEPRGETGLLESFHHYRLSNPRPGMVVLISDFLDPEGFEGPLKNLLSRKFDLNLIQVLAPEEVQPTLAGDLRLIDSETGAATEVSISPSTLRRYRRTAEFYCDSLKRFCQERSVNYLRTLTSDPFEELILRSMRSAAIIG